MEVALDLLSFPIYCWPWTRLLRCGPNLVFKRTEMMRPLLGIVFSPSDKRGLTDPLLHTMVTNRLVTELHPVGIPTCNGECRFQTKIMSDVRNKKKITIMLYENHDIPIATSSSCAVKKYSILCI